jgi:O-antigen ligase
MTFIKYSNLDYVFDRVDNIYESQYSERGISLVSIIDGSTFNRTTAFTEAYAKYDSKESWWLGYGWGLSKNNREAFFVDPNILRSSAHSQIFAILFMFGWLGFIAYFGLIIRLIWQSYQSLGNSLSNINNRIFAYFFMIAFILFLLNEIKADSVYIPGYFAATMILLGLAYSNLNALKYKLE